ncbi:hypothetical protein [Acaryochloris sp. IP29b_bin.148]|uniref:hypothetical protein n=1 Tax=Acaryochloris sp. IP29b_bin.148 TaxID=2969218 RepID=UPI00262EC3D3|nr:hypothetical protein [Acaryochloris sp. IP29b_bin.148]
MHLKMMLGFFPLNHPPIVNISQDDSSWMINRLHDNIHLPVDKIFTARPITLQAPRIAIRASNLGGLIRSRTQPGWTVVIYPIVKAAQQTGDLYFTFGTGTLDRACSLMRFFLDFMNDLQMELLQRTTDLD